MLQTVTNCIRCRVGIHKCYMLRVKWGVGGGGTVLHVTWLHGGLVGYFCTVTCDMGGLVGGAMLLLPGIVCVFLIVTCYKFRLVRV